MTFEFYVGYRLGTANTTAGRIAEFYEIYTQFGEDYEIFLSNLVLAEVRDIVSQYEAFDLFQKREEIGDNMFTSIKTIFKEYKFTLLYGEMNIIWLLIYFF